MAKKTLFQILLAVLLACCQSLYGQTYNGFNLTHATIDISKIKHGGPPKDGIPALTNPTFIKAKQASFLNTDDRVIGVEINGSSKVYPVKILNFHEIVNDELSDKHIIVSYCPLCGSGVVFNAHIENESLEFGVSGLLYNSDVLMYDRNSGSLWSQLMNEAVSGKYAGTKLQMIASTNTTWGAWKKAHPQTMVLSNHTGYQRNYNRTPYTGYDKTKTVYFPVDNWSDTFFAKERVLGIEIAGEFKAYAFSELKKSNGTIEDKFQGKSVKINYDKKTETAYLTAPVHGVRATVLYWFAWFTFHPETNIYKVKK